MSETVDETGLVPLAALAATGLELTRVEHDSRRVRPGSLYACLRGESFDGHRFAREAVAAGAVALLVDHPLPEQQVGDVAQIVVDDTRLRLGRIAATVAGNPSRKMTTVGVTGTNGKTTVAHMLGTIFEANGWKTGIVGTLHGTRTTPEAPELQEVLAEFVADGSGAAVIEVSSHALALHRIDGTEFDAVIFTNLGRDHLDLHGTPEEYFRAKASLFDVRFSSVGVVNIDDPYGRLLADAVESADGGAGVRIVAISGADLSDVDVTVHSHRYRWRGIAVEVPIGGNFNVSNSHVALATAFELGVEPATAVAALGSLQAVPGRFEVVRPSSDTTPGFTVVVDYAHTPDGLSEVLRSARAVAAADASVVVVFGCGGDRDTHKRPEMGSVAAGFADRVFVTSDNPRSEQPEAIISDIVSGIDEAQLARVTTEPDRRVAIRAAITVADVGDVVVIAGKGHERTQDLGTSIVDFDDRVVASELLEDMT